MNNPEELPFVNPRHIYAPSDLKENGDIYMPAFLTAMARMEFAGVSCEFFDENFAPYNGDAPSVAAGLVGALSIPGALELQKRAGRGKLVVGGQIITTLTRKEFEDISLGRLVNGNEDQTLGRVIGFDHTKMPTPKKTSLIPAYEKIPPELLAQYLEHEFSLYVSQGCKYGCTFCAAKKGEVETYRDMEIIENDLEWLVMRAEEFFQRGELPSRELNFYLSNLDTFQMPAQLEKFVEVVKRVRQKHTQDGREFNIKMRGLSTVYEFLKVAEKHPKIIEKLVEAGFHTVGFGIDGMTAAVWKRTGKPNFQHRDLTEIDPTDPLTNAELCIAAVKKAKQFGITPELLMVFGHIDEQTLEPVDSEESMRLAYEFLQQMQEDYGAIPRPQVVKPYPGNKLWNATPYLPVAESIIRHPEAFQALDFVARPSPLSHPDDEFRERVNFWLNKMCSLTGNRSKIIDPLDLDFTSQKVDFRANKKGKIARSTRSRIVQVVKGIPDGAWEKMMLANKNQFDR